MVKSEGLSLLSLFEYLLRLFIVAILLIGLVPALALAQINGTIDGTVTDNSTGGVISGAQVLVFESGAQSPNWNGTTNASGNYSLSIPPGSGYEVAAQKAGYNIQRLTGKNVTADNITIVNFSLVPDTTPPAAVTNLAASNPTQNSITLTWAAPGDDNMTGTAAQYDIRYATSIINNDTIFNSAAQATGIPAPHQAGYNETFTVTGLSANTTYFFALKTRDDANLWSALSNSASANTTPAPPPDTTPPAAVTNLAASNPTQNSITLTWAAPGDDNMTGTAAQYDIRYATSIISNDTIFNSAAQATGIPAPHQASYNEAFTVTGLSANTTYFFALKTRDDANLWSALSNSASANTTAAPPPPGQPSFAIAHSGGKYSFMLSAGDNITESINMTSIDSFTGTVSLSLQVPPELQAISSLSTAQVTLAAGETKQVTLTLGAGAMTPSGTYQCSLNGQTAAYGGQQRSYFFTVIVGVAGQPLLSASPAMVATGSQTTFFASQFSPGENVTLRWDSGPKVGQTLATGQIAGNGTWNVPVTVPADMPGGNFAVKVASTTKSAIFQLTVTSGAGPDFIMSSSPQFISVTPGNSSNVTVYITSVNGFNAPVALSAGSAPGVTCILSTANVTPAAGQAASVTLIIAITAWTSPNMYHINVEGASTNPSITKMVDISLDVPPPAQWGPSISLSQSYGKAGDAITFTGSNFPPSSNNQVVTIKEVFTNSPIQTTPGTITVSNGGFTGTFTIPAGIPSGNYRIRAIVESTGSFAERDFQILGTEETFTLGISPASVTVTTEQGQNSASVSVNIFSVGGNSPTVNLGMEGAPPWLTFQFGSLPVSVPAGGSSSRNLTLTASMTAPTGTYPITVKGWVEGNPEKRVSLQLTVQPPAGFGMAELTLSPTFGESGRTVNFSGSGFTNCSPSQVTELNFGGLNILAGQSLPTITVPSDTGRFSGSFRVPAALSPGTYPLEIRVGSPPNDKFIVKFFTITGGSATFVLQVSPSFLWVEQGHSIGTMVQVQATGSSSANVSLSIEGCPPDITTSFASGNVTAPPGGVASTDLTLATQSWLPAGHYTITIKGQLIGGAEVHRIPLEVEVAPPAGFNMASIYLSPTMGTPGTWVTISGSGFPISSTVAHLYVGSPAAENDWASRLPSIITNGSGAMTAVIQFSANLTPGTYPIEVVVGNPPADKRASAQFTLVSNQASFNISLSPTTLQTAPGSPVSTSVNVQSVGSSSANITLQVEGPPNIQWRFDGGAWQTPKLVSPSIGGTVFSSLEVVPAPSTPMGYCSLAVKATAGQQQEYRNLGLDVGAAAGYNMPIFSLNPNNGMTGTSVAFSGSNFPATTTVTGITFGSGNISLPQAITTSPQGSFSGAFTVPSTVGGQPTAPGTYKVRVTVDLAQAETQFNVYGSNDTFTISLSPNFLQGGPGGEPRTSCQLQALGGASPSVKMAVRGLPPGVTTKWNGNAQSIFSLSTPPGGQIYFELILVLPNMIPMGQYPAVLEGWVDTNQNDLWDTGETIVRANLELAVMPPQGYGMGMFSLTPTYGRVGDTVTFAGTGFPANTAIQSLTFAQTNILSNNITTSADGSFSGLFTVPGTAFGTPTGPGMYPVDVVVGAPPNDRRGSFGFQVVSSNQKFSIGASPGWLARPAGDTGSVSIAVRSLVTTPPSPTIVIRVDGLPMGITPSFASANVTPPFGNMESRELRLTISNGCPMGKYPISIRAYNAAAPAEEMMTSFTLEVTPSSGFMDMGMAMVTLSASSGTAGGQITVSGYGFPKSQNLTWIHFGPNDVTPTSVNATTDAAGAFNAVITVPSLPPGPHPVEVNVQNTIRMAQYSIMGVNDTFALNVSPMWLEPIPAGDPNGRQIAITVSALTGKTPTVTLSIEGLFTAFGSITEVWEPVSKVVTVGSAGGTATALLTLKPPQNLPPGPYPFTIVGVDAESNRRAIHMEFRVGPPINFMSGTMANVFFSEIMLSPSSGPAGTQVSYTGSNVPPSATVVSINFGGKSVPLPPSGLTADSTGSFSGSFVVNEAWGLPAGGMYRVEFRLEKEGWTQAISRDFNLMSSDAKFSLEVTPNWIPPIPPGGYGQTMVNVKALGYTSVNVTLAVMETFGGMGIPGGAQAHWNTNDGPATSNTTVPAAGQTSKAFYLQGNNPGRYMITLVGWIDSDADQVLDYNVPSESGSAFSIPLDFEVQPPMLFMDKTWMTQNGVWFPEITLNPDTGQAGAKVTIQATNFPGGANVTSLKFAGTSLPIPAGIAADNLTGNFTLVFNVPATMWGGDTTSGWYDVQVEAQKAGVPPISIMKPFQVISSDIAFTLRADPNWLPPIPAGSSGSTLVRVMSTSSASANVTLSVERIPPGVTTAFSSSVVNVTPGGSGSATLTLTPATIPPGRYGAEIKGTATVSGTTKTFYTHLEFEVQPPMQFMDKTWMTQNNAWFPEITLDPNVGQPDTKVTIQATSFPGGANVTSLRFAGMSLPVPAGIAADNLTGTFTLVFNVPRTIWGGDIASGWYDVQVEAQKAGMPPVSIMKPFQVTASDVAFTLRADPNWLPPIPPSSNGSSTIFINSTGAGATVTLSVERIPPGVTTAFSSSVLNVSPGGSASATLTLTPTAIPPGRYGAEIKGTATVSGATKTFYTHLEFEVQPPMQFMDKTWMTQNNIWFPEITLNPNAGQPNSKVTVTATNFPTGASVTSLRFAGMSLPVPAGIAADNTTGAFTLVFNVPGDLGIGNYMVEVEAVKAGIPPVFIAKPFFIEGSGVSFKLNVVPGFIPGVAQGDSGQTTIFVESTGQAATVQLYVDGLPPGVTTVFDSSIVSASPGGSSSTRLTITTGASTPPGQYPLTIRGVSGGETRMMPFGFGVMPPATFQMPRFILNPDYAPAGYADKKYTIAFSGTGFTANQSVASLKFGSQSVVIPANLTTDATGAFNGVFQMPTGLDPGIYDVRVTVATGGGGYVYDSRPFSIRGADAKFILQLSPPYLPPIVQGGQGTITVNTRSVGTTTANVTLFVDGLAPGISAAFTPSNVVTVSPGSSGSANLTFTVSASTPPGPCPVSIRGVSGSETAVVPLGFGIMPNIGSGAGYATITINPPRARPGEHIGISGAGFISGNTITLTAAPPGALTPINITPGTIQVQPDGTWATEITVPPAAQVPPGTYIIKAVGGNKDAKSPFSIVPAENADFFLNLSPQFLKVTQGYTGNTTMTLSSKNGFKEAVRFSVGHLAPGVTATFKDTLGNTIGKFTGMPGGTREVIAPTLLTPIPGEALTITVVLEADTATPIGPYDIALEAGTSTIVRSVPLSLMVVSTGASMVISPMSGPADTDIRLSGTGFTAGETVAVTFASDNITTVPATITVAQDGTFTALITAPSMAAGIYPVKVTGATSGTIIDRPFGLMPSSVNTFVLYASPQKVDIPKGGSGTITVKIEPLGSFQSAVTLSVSGLSAIAGATANITPSSTVVPSIATPTTATLTITVPAGASEGRYSLVITGTSGAITQTRNVTVPVVPPANTPDFAISLAPNTIPIMPGSSGNTTVTVTSVNGFADSVNLTLAMSDPAATWPVGVSYTAGSVTPSTATGLGKQLITLTVASGTQPGNWTFRVTGTSGALEHSAEVMVICTPSGTTLTPYASPRLDPTTITSSTPVNITPPWGDRITINSLINDGSEASIITPSTANVTPATLASLPAGASDVLGRITNVESSAPVDGVQWNIGFPFDSANLTAAGLREENLKVAYLSPDTGVWTQVTTTVDTTNKIAYASPTHFSSWTLIATPAPPPSNVVSGFGGGGGGGGGTQEVTNIGNSVATDGKFIQTVSAFSEDGRAQLTIARDTIGKGQTGQRLDSLTIKETTAPSASPSDARFVGQVYNIGPNGATFDPPINLTLKYYESKIPQGVAEKNLVVATWDSANGNWVKLESAVDPEANAVTAMVSHFSTFTLLAYTRPANLALGGLNIAPAEVGPGEKVNISVTVANTGDLTGSYEVALRIDDVLKQTKEVKLDGGDSTTVSFSVSLDTVGKHAVNVGGLLGTLEVRVPRSPAAFAVSRLSISPAEANIGEKVNISVTVANTGEMSGSYKVALKVNDAIIVIRDVTLAGGARQEVTFSTTKDTAGTYTVDVSGLTATFTVRPAPAKPAEPSLTPVPVQPTAAPEQPTPSIPSEPVAPITEPTRVSLWLLIGIAMVGIAIGAVIWRLARRRAQ